jgi:hypothetical protein
MPGIFRKETHAGTPIDLNGVRLFPFAESLRLFLPVMNFSLVWNRPVSILAIGADGKEQVIPIRDRTREIVWTVYGAIGLLAVITTLIEHRKRGDK